MTAATDSTDSFAVTLHAAYHDVRLHSPQGIDEVAERLRAKLERSGVALTPDILRALAFAIVNGRDL
jgi:hypothetical protein